MAGKRTPNRHTPARHVKFPGHDGPIPAVVARADQHHHGLAAPPASGSGAQQLQHPVADGQGRFFHQGRLGHAPIEHGLLNGLHLPGVNQQMGGIRSGPLGGPTVGRPVIHGPSTPE